MDVLHAITDGTGAYEVIRTFLYYYVTERYGAELTKDGVRLLEPFMKRNGFRNRGGWWIRIEV